MGEYLNKEGLTRFKEKMLTKVEELVGSNDVVTSVDGKTGAVDLSSTYQPKGNYLTSAPVTSVNGSKGDVTINDYVTSITISGKTVTIAKKDGTSTTQTTQDSTYTLPTASSSTLGGVKTGSNITNSSGTISLTKTNVTSALGYTPLQTAPVTSVNGQTGAISGLVSSINGMKADASGNVALALNVYLETPNRTTISSGGKQVSGASAFDVTYTLPYNAYVTTLQSYFNSGGSGSSITAKVYANDVQIATYTTSAGNTQYATAPTNVYYPKGTVFRFTCTSGANKYGSAGYDLTYLPINATVS